MSAESIDKASPAWWHGARAALARALGQVRVQTPQWDALQVTQPDAGMDAVVWAAPPPGTRESGWPLAAQTYQWQPPAAPAGGNNLDAALVPCPVSANAAPALTDTGISVAALVPPAPPVRTASVQELGENVASLPLAVALSGGAACQVPVAVAAPGMWAVSVSLAGTPRGAAKRGSAGRGVGVPPIAMPRVREGLTLLARLPVVRRRALVPADADADAVFAAGRRALASACGGSEGDMKLLAWFPGVPLALVQQMAITENGDALRLWLRPDALASGAAATAARVTVVLGRRRSTGEAVRAVLPEARPAHKA